MFEQIKIKQLKKMIKRLYLFIFTFVCLGMQIYRGQNKILDSLIHYVKVAPQDTHKLAVLTMVIEAINEDAVWSPFNDMLGALAKEFTLHKNPAIKLFGKKHYSAFLNNKGYLNNNLGAVTQALECFHQSLKIQEEIGDKAGQSYSLNNIGYIYNSQKEYLSALNYYQKSFEIQKEIGDKFGQAISLSNIGNIYDKTGSYKKALFYYFKGLNIRRSIKDKSGIGYSLQNIGGIYLNLKSYFSAKYYFTKSLEIRKLINDEKGISYALCNLGKIFLEENNLVQAKKHTEEALRIARKIGFPENISNAAITLEDIYLIEEKYDKAHAMLSLAVKMRDSISNNELQNSMVKKQLQYEFEKKEVISKAEQEKREFTYQVKEKQQRSIMYSVSGGLVICFFFGAFTYNRFKITQKQNVIIQSQKKVVEDQKHIVETHQKEIVDSINYAKRIQYALLANDHLFTENLKSHFILFKPKDIVSGDFYWATVQDNKFYLAVCDSTGHGVPGAFMSLLNMGFLSEAINEKKISEPHAVLNYVRERLVTSISKEGQQDGFDGVILCIDQITGEISYAAAHNAPLLISEFSKGGNDDLENKSTVLKKDKMPVGKGEKQDSFTTHSLKLNEGHTLYLYTDGFADQFGGPKGKKFKYKQLEQLLLESSSLSVSEQKETLLKKFEEWRGNLEQVDDVLIIGIKV
ncbi:MAG: protein serine/threonine phosphatase [Bacteroidetes bacterium]|nr:protein serine/threonine phosphatase [Bacteroidota bacterium]